MPSVTLPAAATGLPTRRTALLASLAGLGAAVSLLTAAKAAAVSISDAALIAAAEVVVGMATECTRMWERLPELEGLAHD